MRLSLVALFLAAPLSAAPAWRESLPEALAEAKAKGLPLLLDFQAPWCYSCYYMDQHVLGRDSFGRAAEGLVLLKIDVDTPEGRALKEKYRVTFLPTYVLFDAQGRPLGRIVGEQAEADFLARLSELRRPAAAGGALGPTIAALKARLAAGEEEAAARELAAEPSKTLKALRERRDWRILEARLKLGRAAGSPRYASQEPLGVLLEIEDSCELAYDVFKGEKIVDSLYPESRSALLEAEAKALERLVEVRLFGAADRRCADFRSPIEALAGVYEKLGNQEKRRELLGRAIAWLEGQVKSVGEDRNRDDNLRFFLEKAGEEGRLEEHYRALIRVYPADYVYAYRFARYLEERHGPEAALPWIEKADKLAYGANRLAVTKVRAKILRGLGRAEEAAEFLRRDIKAGRKSFPKESAELEKLLGEAGASKP